jgi:hypothetical protein
MPSPRKQIILGVVALLLVGLLGFPKGDTYAWAGVLCGAAVSIFSILSLSLVVGMLTASRPAPRQGAVMVTLVNALKLPVLVVGILLGTRLPPVGLYCFLASLGLVYFLSVWFLVERAQHPDPYEKIP